jgi:hypothetical protein
VRDEILKSHPQSRLRVYAVWFPVLPGDSSVTVDRWLLTDVRVDNFWDPQRVVGNWFSEHVTDQPGITWDAYFLFGSDATWISSPSPIASSGSPVIGNRDSLTAAFDRLETVK